MKTEVECKWIVVVLQIDWDSCDMVGNILDWDFCIWGFVFVPQLTKFGSEIYNLYNIRFDGLSNQSSMVRWCTHVSNFSAWFLHGPISLCTPGIVKYIPKCRLLWLFDSILISYVALVNRRSWFSMYWEEHVRLSFFLRISMEKWLKSDGNLKSTCPTEFWVVLFTKKEFQIKPFLSRRFRDPNFSMSSSEILKPKRIFLWLSLRASIELTKRTFSCDRQLSIFDLTWWLG